MENEAHRDWRIKECPNPAGWWTVGYTYVGTQGAHQGEFVPVHSWKGRAEAEAFQTALLEGCSRDEAKQRAKEA
jgi:hypothetical protein